MKQVLKRKSILIAVAGALVVGASAAHAEIGFKAGAWDLPRPRGPVEGREDPVPLVIGHADAAVGHADLGLVPDGRQRDIDG